MNKDDLKIVFFGTPEFAVASLDALVKGGYNIQAVVTMPDKTGGRGNKIIESDVKRYAFDHNIRLLQPDKLKDPVFVNDLKAINADLFIVIAFRMLPEVVWTMPRFGTFNLHGSLLPKYRGAAPINRAIMNGEKETGVTTFFLKHEIDTGDIICQRSISIGENDNVGKIYDELMYIGADMVIETVDSIISGTLKTIPQPEGTHIPAPKIFKDDCRIDWYKSSEEIHNQVRGLSPYPCACSTIYGENRKDLDVKIFETQLIKDADLISSLSGKIAEPGDIYIDKTHMYVATGTNPIEVLSIQPSGKKRMDVKAFLLGYRPILFK